MLSEVKRVRIMAQPQRIGEDEEAKASLSPLLSFAFFHEDASCLGCCLVKNLKKREKKKANELWSLEDQHFDSCVNTEDFRK